MAQPSMPRPRLTLILSFRILAFWVVLLPTPTSTPGQNLPFSWALTYPRFCCRVCLQALMSYRYTWGRMQSMQPAFIQVGQSCRYSYLDHENTDGAMWISLPGNDSQYERESFLRKSKSSPHRQFTQDSSLQSSGGRWPLFWDLYNPTVQLSQPAVLGIAGSLSSPCTPSIPWLRVTENIILMMNYCTSGWNPFIHWKLFFSTIFPDESYAFQSGLACRMGPPVGSPQVVANPNSNQANTLIPFRWAASTRYLRGSKLNLGFTLRKGYSSSREGSAQKLIIEKSHTAKQMVFMPILAHFSTTLSMPWVEKGAWVPYIANQIALIGAVLTFSIAKTSRITEALMRT